MWANNANPGGGMYGQPPPNMMPPPPQQQMTTTGTVPGGMMMPPSTPMLPGGTPGGAAAAAANAAAAATAATATSNLKHDIFVGNLAFNTTEEQLYSVFHEVGKVVNVRMVTDPDTGKLRGFAFVEFEDPQAALSAIRNMNEYELNGRKLRVNFSNSSHLEALAGKLGMDLSSNPNTLTPGVTNRALLTGSSGVSKSQLLSTAAATAAAASGGTNAVADALKSFTKGEMYDVISKLKEIADRDPDEARRIIAGHPQLPEALLYLMSKIDMIKTSLPNTNQSSNIPTNASQPPSSMVGGQSATANAMMTGATDGTMPMNVQPPSGTPTPDLGIAPPTTTTPIVQPAVAPPAAARIDPRQRVDPRAARAAAVAASATPNPQQQMIPQQQQQQQQQPQQILAYQQQQQQQQQQQGGIVPPPPPPPAYTPQSMNIPSDMNAHQQQMYMQQQQQQRQQQMMQQQQQGPPPPQMIVPLDPGLVQQVMSLTPQQIQQLPPDKQQSILQLRQQITGSLQ